MGIKDDYLIQKISYKQAMEIVIENHYLHRKAPCSYAFGLIERVSMEIIGVVVYGKPASPSLCKGICGNNESSNVGELTRLWIKDGTPKNVESFLIGNTIQLVSYDILVSFAEIMQGHTGIVYQATNWIYTGLSAKHVQWVYDGLGNAHSRHWAKEYGGVKKGQRNTWGQVNISRATT